jgi:hypothetical protein
MVYIRYQTEEEYMKITHRSDKGKGGHLLISVPASRGTDVEAALTFLEAKRQQRGSQVVIALISAAAERTGWRYLPEGESRL